MTARQVRPCSSWARLQGAALAGELVAQVACSTAKPACSSAPHDLVVVVDDDLDVTVSASKLRGRPASFITRAGR